MTAAATVPGSAWAGWVVGIVLLLVVVALVVDRVRTTRRLDAARRAQALLETDLGDARREVAQLRDAVRGGRVGEPRSSGRPPASSGPSAPVS